MEVKKQLPPLAADTELETDMAEINALARKTLAPEEVYTFNVRLCDNEVDRDGERFPEETLRALQPMFVGKSGIFDHSWSAKEQTARIYHTELCYEPGKITRAGDDYCYLKAKAYMLRTEKNRELMEEIEGGIKKEVSVGCSVREAVCSLCGAKRGECDHVPGREYNGKLCYTELRGAEDAYEWSFVAVPAQRGAGVMKQFSPETRTLKEFVQRQGSDAFVEEMRALETEAALGRNYLKGLRREVLRLSCLAEQEMDGRIFSGMLEKLEEKELLELRRMYRKRTEQWSAAEPQLPYHGKRAEGEDGSAFLI